MHYTIDFLLSQHANYWTIKEMMAFIVPVPLLSVMCWNRADLKVPLSVPVLVSSARQVTKVVNGALEGRSGPLFQKEHSFMTAAALLCKKAVSERVSKPPEALATRRRLLGDGNRSALCAGWNFLFQELQLALWASQRWLQWSPFLPD